MQKVNVIIFLAECSQRQEEIHCSGGGERMSQKRHLDSLAVCLTVRIYVPGAA